MKTTACISVIKHKNKEVFRLHSVTSNKIKTYIPQPSLPSTYFLSNPSIKNVTANKPPCRNVSANPSQQTNRPVATFSAILPQRFRFSSKTFKLI